MSTEGVPGWAKGLVAVIVAIGGVLIPLVATGVFDGDDCAECDRPPQQVQVPAGVQSDADQKLEPAEQQQAGARPLEQTAGNPVANPNLANAGPDIHQDTKDETPPGITERESADAEIEAPGVGQPRPAVGAQNYSCTPHYVVNQSPLSGARSGVALHFTVSPPGSLQGIWRLFNTPSFGASSNYGIELDGECEIWVAISRKGWAQGAFNSAYISIEIVTNDLSRAQWLAAPIVRDGILASLVADLLRQVGAPPRLVDPEGCAALAGVTDHKRLECGNTHWDLGDHFPWDKFMPQVRAAYSGADPVCDTACHRLAARKIKHRKTHRHYARHVEAGECKAHVHKVRPGELHRQHCRALKEKIHTQHAGIRRAKRAAARS